MNPSLTVRAALVAALVASTPALAHIHYVGKGFTKSDFEATDVTLASEDSFAITDPEAPPASWVWRVTFSDPRIHILSWRGSDEYSQFIPTTSFEVGFAGSLGIADVAYLPIRVEANLGPQSATAAPELSTAALTALGFAALALAMGATRRLALNAAPRTSA